MNTPAQNVSFVILLLLFAAPAPWAAERIDLFNGRDLSGWESKRFAGDTRYTLAETGDRPALRAQSRASASGLYKEIEIDLEKTPYLHWSWRVDNTLGAIDETTRGGDDYPARVYVVVSGGVFFWKTRAVNYVWASARARHSEWPNAYTGNARMIAVESGGELAGQWVSERRDVRADLRRLFGEDIRYIHAVALMTDTDNTGAQASAWYGEIYFAAE